jgi:CheY-like chemotaxis protein
MFEAGPLDILVADDEDMVRLSACSLLTRFGFPSSSVHEAEDRDTVLAKLEALQPKVEDDSADRVGSVRHTPIFVIVGKSRGVAAQICAQSILDRFQERKWLREPFIVGALSKTRYPDANDAFPCFHAIVLKTFEPTKIHACLEECHRWWSHGGGRPKGTVRLMSTTVTPLMSATATPSSASGFHAKQEYAKASALVKDLCKAVGINPIAHEDPLSPTASTAEAQVSGVISAPDSLPQAEPTPLGVRFQSEEGKALPRLSRENSSEKQEETEVKKGKALSSLGSLLPAVSPFEDVEAVQLVGRGAYGDVYRARWGVSNVALKVVQCDQNDGFEGALSQSLSHPNLIQTFKFARREKISAGSGYKVSTNKKVIEVWIVQEWCSLGTLSQNLERKNEVDIGAWFSEVTEVSAEIASAAAYLHSRGIVHGDLTGNNVLYIVVDCKKGYTTKVSDFGLARVLGNGSTGIETASLGTVSYMPPEMFKLNACTLTRKVDVYSFGVIMWQLLTGTTPFDGMAPTQVVVSVAEGASLQLPPEVPESIAKVFRSCTCRSPDERADMDGVFQELLQLLDLEVTLKQKRTRLKSSRKFKT